MKNRKIKNKNHIVIWIKRLTALIATAVWIAVLYNILDSGGEFGEQAPVCMFSTMAIFAVLTGVYKGLEQWEHRE